MRDHRISAAALLALAAVAVLISIYRDVIWHFLAALVAVRLAWFVMRAKLGIRKARRSGKSFWEVAGAGLLGFAFGRHGNTHPCGKCGAPIAHPSRAVYCSPACRRYAALERRETERRAERLAAFGDVPDGFGEIPYA